MSTGYRRMLEGFRDAGELVVSSNPASEDGSYVGFLFGCTGCWVVFWQPEQIKPPPCNHCGGVVQYLEPAIERRETLVK